MNISGMSASAYDLHSMCPFKYYLQYVLGFEDLAGSSAMMGTIAHKLLEILSRASVNNHDPSSKVWNLEYLWNICFNHYYKELPTVAESIDNSKLKKVCQGVHDLIDSSYSPIRNNTIIAEASFNIPLTVNKQIINLRGRIDRVDKIDDDTIEIVDYKTGTRTSFNSQDRKKKGVEELHKEIQPRMYHLAAKYLYPEYKNILVTFIYLVDGGPVTVPFCDYDAKITKEMLKDKVRAIKSDNDPRRNQGWWCNSFCSHGKSGLCDKVWNEKNQVGIDFVNSKYTVLNFEKRRHRK